MVCMLFHRFPTICLLETGNVRNFDWIMVIMNVLIGIKSSRSNIFDKKWISISVMSNGRGEGGAGTKWSMYLVSLIKPCTSMV